MPEEVHEATAWDLSDDSSDEDAQQGQPEQQRQDEVPPAGGGVQPLPVTDWATFNEKQRGNSKKFALQQPRDRLIISVITLGVCVSVLHAFEHVASERWDHLESERCAAGGTRSSRMWEAYSGGLSQPAADTVARLSMSTQPWKALRPQARSWGLSGLAFVMLSVSICALDQLLFRFWRTFPYRLWELTIRPSMELAQEFLDTPRCLMDQFSILFLNIFDTPAKLLSASCRAVLVALGYLVRWDIARLECRHASIRRLQLARARSYPAEFMKLSCAFVLQRQRLLERWTANKKLAGALSMRGLRRDVQRGCAGWDVSRGREQGVVAHSDASWARPLPARCLQTRLPNLLSLRRSRCNTRSQQFTHQWGSRGRSSWGG